MSDVPKIERQVTPELNKPPNKRATVRLFPLEG